MAHSNGGHSHAAWAQIITRSPYGTAYGTISTPYTVRMIRIMDPRQISALDALLHQRPLDAKALVHLCNYVKGMAIYTVIQAIYTVSTPYFPTPYPIQNTGYLHRGTMPTPYYPNLRLFSANFFSLTNTHSSFPRPYCRLRRAGRPHHCPY